MRDHMKSYDAYGQPISLHYEGEDSFKTCPGGCISLLLILIIYIYALVKGKQMLRREEWSLVQQEVVSSIGELSNTYSFNETQFTNISIALQFYTKKEK